jgi:hypothetical protein
MTSGYAPVIQSVNQNPVYAQFLADSQNPDIPQASTEFLQAVSVKQAVSQLTAYYVSPAFNGSSAARDEVGLMMQRCFTTAASDVDAMISKQFEDTVKKLSKKYDE